MQSAQRLRLPQETKRLVFVAYIYFASTRLSTLMHLVFYCAPINLVSRNHFAISPIVVISNSALAGFDLADSPYWRVHRSSEILTFVEPQIPPCGWFQLVLEPRVSLSPRASAPSPWALACASYQLGGRVVKAPNWPCIAEQMPLVRTVAFLLSVLPPSASGSSPCTTVIPQSHAGLKKLTQPNSNLAWYIWLSFGYVFCMGILAPESPTFALKGVFWSPTIQTYDHVHGLEIQKIKDYASKEWDWAKSKQGRFVELALVGTLI